MSRVLVTGMTGFFGAKIAECLRARAFDVFGTTSGPALPLCYPCDIRDSAQVDALVERISPDVIVHCAAISGVTINLAVEYYQTNVLGTENLLKSAGHLGKRVRFMHISTAGVYGNQSREFLDEDLEPLPVQHYGLSKYCSERLVKVNAENLDFTIIRPFNIIGAGQSRNFIVPKLIAAFAARQAQIRLGNIDVYRDYVDVDSACEIVCDLVGMTRSFCETINLCTGIGTSLREVLSYMAKIGGYEIEVIVAPEFVRLDEVWKLLGSRIKLDRILGRPIPMYPVEKTLLKMYEQACS